MSRSVGAMHVAKISRRHGDREYVSHLVRRSVRDGRRVRHELIANVSGLPVEAVLAAAQRLGLARLLDRQPSRQRDLCMAMIAGRLLAGGSNEERRAGVV